HNAQSPLLTATPVNLVITATGIILVLLLGHMEISRFSIKWQYICHQLSVALSANLGRVTLGSSMSI
ncbi:hypothetical protein, partial [Vibrio cholerae]|uniref:hypothetical protein n=1 Tax=Vibrio cholerae TaxID=666 RepID=UPI001FEDCF2C